MKNKIAAAILLSVGLIQPSLAADVVKFGSLRVPSAINVAIDKGFFAAEGIEVERVYFKSGAETAPAVATGQVDFVATTSGAALYNAFVRGIDVQIVGDALTAMPGAASGDPTAIVVRKALLDSGEVKKAADLAKRKIAITSPGQVVGLTIDQYLQSGGLTIKDVEIVNMPYPDMLAALKGGAIDAALMIDPFITLAQKQGTGEKLVGTADVLPGLQQAFYVYGKRLTEKERDLGQRLMNALVRTNSWMLDAVATPKGREEIAEIYQKAFPQPNPALYREIAIIVGSPGMKVDVDGKYGLTWQIAQLQQRGLLLGDPKIIGHVDNSFVEKALKSKKN